MATTINTGGRKKAEINMTPLIDVLLALIIIFMVITPLTSRGLPTLVAQPPPSERRDDKQFPKIVMTVRSDGTLLLNSEPLNLKSLRIKLEHFYKDGATGVIFVRSGRATEFGRVAEVIDMARGAGFYQVALMTN